VKRRRIDPRRAKLLRTYTVDEAARLFGIHRNTVRAWLKSGLKAIDGGRPVLVLGSELRRFHNERRANRRCPTPVGMIYCLRCREPRRPAGDMADYLPRTTTTGDLQGICPKCDAMLYRRVRLRSLEAVRGGLDVTVREGNGRISQRDEPSLNHDSGNRPVAHADAQS
jgi:excisionase family DNA binding protein